MLFIACQQVINLSGPGSRAGTSKRGWSAMLSACQLPELVVQAAAGRGDSARRVVPSGTSTACNSPSCSSRSAQGISWAQVSLKVNGIRSPSSLVPSKLSFNLGTRCELCVISGMWEKILEPSGAGGSEMCRALGAQEVPRRPLTCTVDGSVLAVCPALHRMGMVLGETRWLWTPSGKMLTLCGARGRGVLCTSWATWALGV